MTDENTVVAWQCRERGDDEWFDISKEFFNVNPQKFEYRELVVKSNKHPDWSESETAPSEIWKNPLHSLQCCLLMADGVIAFRGKVIENLRSQLTSVNAQKITDEAREECAKLCEGLRSIYGEIAAEDIRELIGTPLGHKP